MTKMLLKQSLQLSNNLCLEALRMKTERGWGEVLGGLTRNFKEPLPVVFLELVRKRIKVINLSLNRDVFLSGD